MAEQLRGAVIGTGGVGRLRHITAFQEADRLGTATLVAICDPVLDSVNAAGEIAGISDRYQDYRDLLARDDIDVVTIATPNSAHEPIAIAALDSGKHVMCEKPLALSLEGARRMAETAHRTGLRTSVNHRYRWVPSARYMKELIDSGDVGDVRQVFMQYFNASVVDPVSPIQWRQTQAEGGGLLGDLGSHLIDLAIWLLGPIDRVRCDLRTFTQERTDARGERVSVDVDDAATVQVEFASGATGTLDVSGVCLGYTNHQRVEVYGTGGGLVHQIDAPADTGSDQLLACFSGPQTRTIGMAPAPVPPRHAGTPLDSFLDFFQAIHDDRPAPVTFDDAVRVQEIIDAAERSAAANGNWMQPHTMP